MTLFSWCGNYDLSSGLSGNTKVTMAEILAEETYLTPGFAK